MEDREWRCCLEADVLQQAVNCSRWREEEIGAGLAARGVTRKAVVLLAVKYARERSVGNDWGSLAVAVALTLMLVGRRMLIFRSAVLARLCDAMVRSLRFGLLARCATLWLARVASLPEVQCSAAAVTRPFRSSS